MPSNNLALQAESLPTETPFEALPLQEERSVEEEGEEEEVAETEGATEGATEEIPTTPTTEGDALLTMASSVAKNPQSSQAIERTLRLSYLSGRSIRC
jgi:hypothetical protein